MVGLHGVLAYASAAAGMIVLVASLAAVALGARMRVWLDRAVLLALVVLFVAALSGLPLPILTRPPADPLHVLYAAVAPGVLLAARYLGRNGTVRRRGLLLALGAVALLGVTYRLFTTVG